MKRLLRRAYATIPFKRPLYGFIRKQLGIVPPFYQHLHFEGPFELAIDEKRSIKLFSTGNIVENELFWLGFGAGWEGTSLKLWRRLCDGNEGTILDIGANSGVYALVAARLAPGADVIAFEPISRVAQDLRRNVELNRLPICVKECAVSDRDGTTMIFDLPTVFNYSASLEGQGPNAVQVEVPVCRIDTFLSKTDKPVTAMKIDVERHEPAAVAGMKNILQRDRPAILIEILDRAIGDTVADRVRGLGYRLFHILEGKGLVPATALEPVGDHDWNHLLCTDQQFESLALREFLVP